MSLQGLHFGRNRLLGESVGDLQKRGRVRDVTFALLRAAGSQDRLSGMHNRTRHCVCRTGLAIVLFGSAITPLCAGDSGADIEVLGLKTLSPDAVRTHVSAPNASADRAALDAALQSIMATGNFADAKIDQRGHKIVVTVVENPIIAAVTVSGTSAIDKKTLDPVLKLKAGDRYTLSRGHSDATRIRDFHRRQGRLTTTVTPAAVARPDGRVDVDFSVTEGPVNKIEHIEFTGARAFSTQKLRDIISTSESTWLDVLKAAAFYDPQRIENDRELIQRHYANHGYPQARVTDVKADLDAQKGSYRVTFVIDEGNSRVFGVARIESEIAGLDVGVLEGSLKIKPGAPYDHDAIDRSMEAMSELLATSGQPFARVQAIPRTDSGSQKIDIVFSIEAGPALYVERIEIVGNEHTKDVVIRRELKLSEGDQINAFLVERARSHVKRLGFFKSVDLKIDKGSAADRARLVVTVVEDGSASVTVGAGYSSAEGVIGEVSYTERNLLGNGQYVQLKFSGSVVRWQAEASFTEPHLLGTNVAGGFDLFYKDTDNTLQSSYKSRRVGGDVRFGVAVSDQLSASVNYTFVRSTLYDVGPTASLAIREAVPGFPTNTSSNYNTSSVGYGVAYDTRDKKKHPTSGVYVTENQDLAGVGGDVRYIRSTADARGYVPIADGVTFMGRVSGGTIAGWGGQDVRLLDLFNKGGETVRGFAAAGIGPRDAASVNQDALGGRNYAAATAETTFQIPGVAKDVGLSGAAFVDAGSLWGANKTAAALPGVVGTGASLRASTGVGIGWDSPLGTLRADYAIPLLKQSYDKTQAFSFGVVP